MNKRRIKPIYRSATSPGIDPNAVLDPRDLNPPADLYGRFTASFHIIRPTSLQRSELWYRRRALKWLARLPETAQLSIEHRERIAERIVTDVDPNAVLLAARDRIYMMEHPHEIADFRGEGNKNAKLTEAQVKEIIVRHDKGETQAALSREYRVHKSTIFFIVNRITWRYVK